MHSRQGFTRRKTQLWKVLLPSLFLPYWVTWLVLCHFFFWYYLCFKPLVEILFCMLYRHTFVCMNPCNSFCDQFIPSFNSMSPAVSYWFMMIHTALSPFRLLFLDFSLQFIVASDYWSCSSILAFFFLFFLNSNLGFVAYISLLNTVEYLKCLSAHVSVFPSH